MAVDMELEMVLRPHQYPMAPYPPKFIVLANGKRMVIRQAEREDVPAILESVHPCLFIDRDYYDIVSARLYGELLAWYRYRVKSEYCLIGQIDGFLVGIVNGRMETEKVGMSYHTLAIDRGLRIGSHLFAAKMEYHLEYLGQEEVLIVAESPIGFRRWMIEYPLEKTNIPHELGGGDSYLLTRDIYFKAKPRLVVGDRPVPKKLMDEATAEIKFADDDTIREKIAGLKGR
jgi:N-acetylglutamate synthase-like GNAT family acetyltransferase